MTNWNKCFTNREEKRHTAGCVFLWYNGGMLINFTEYESLSASIDIDEEKFLLIEKAAERIINNYLLRSLVAPFKEGKVEAGAEKITINIYNRVFHYFGFDLYNQDIEFNEGITQEELEFLSSSEYAFRGVRVSSGLTQIKGYIGAYAQDQVPADIKMAATMLVNDLIDKSDNPDNIINESQGTYNISYSDNKNMNAAIDILLPYKFYD